MIPILYEDNHLLVIEKPVNQLVQADDTQDPDVLSELKADLKIRYQKPGAVYLGLVHRLDRPVGGVMVFAKTSKAASRLSESIRTRTFEKTYLAVVVGCPQPQSGTCEHWLLKNTKTNQVQVVNEKTPGAKHALLDYTVLAHEEGLSLVRIHLHTGRSHQIRVQMQALGTPLWGDQRYNPQAKKGQQIALWAYQLTFPHPTKKEPVTFTCHPHADPFTRFKEELR